MPGILVKSIPNRRGKKSSGLATVGVEIRFLGQESQHQLPSIVVEMNGLGFICCLKDWMQLAMI